MKEEIIPRREVMERIRRGRNVVGRILCVRAFVCAGEGEGEGRG